MAVSPHGIEVLATACFALAVIHTFLAARVEHFSRRFRPGSISRFVFHALGEVEVVFGFWAILFLFGYATQSWVEATNYLTGRNFHEPVFVFTVMVVCSTGPVLKTVNWVMEAVARLLEPFLARALRVPNAATFTLFFVVFVIGPILGSFITEPAAMTLCALIARDRFFAATSDMRFRYAMLALLFVNVSIGGVLTSYAAPPVLMVAKTWNWDSQHMFMHFGWKAVLACVISTVGSAFFFRRSLSLISVDLSPEDQADRRLARSKPKVKEAFLVAFFLAGLVVLGGLQNWWLEPLLTSLGDFALFTGAIGLTAITDNAALTYLGSQVAGLSETAKYALVAGAVTGGGLTVIANAPNPAGYGILAPSFGDQGIAPLRLFLAAIVPTLIAALIFWLL